jgi:hypothetical protein
MRGFTIRAALKLTFGAVKSKTKRSFVPIEQTTFCEKVKTDKKGLGQFTNGNRDT